MTEIMASAPPTAESARRRRRGAPRPQPPAASGEEPTKKPTFRLAPAALHALAAAAHATPALADAKAEAKTVYETRCATCHGAAGTGDGAAAAALVPKPRNFKDAAFQKSVTDDGLAKAIVDGGPAVGKSPLMPPNPDLKPKADVVKELVALVRAFGK